MPLFYDYLPATRICSKPFIFVSFLEDFARRMSGFKMWYDENVARHENICVFFMFGYHYETPARMEWAKARIAEIRRDFPKLDMRFLCNSEIEKKNFEAIGQIAEFCNQNAFLRESRYRVTGCKKIYDALYLARITPIKRHALALKIPRLFLIGDYFKSEAEYAEGILEARRSDTVWVRRVRGIFMFLYINKAKVGLALSPEEGAMYACAEYGLCGLPVVTTRCLGGREYSLSPKYVRYVECAEPTAEAVAKAVEDVVAENFDPREVRRATIDVFNEHRTRYMQLVKNYFKECGQGGNEELYECLDFPHKFGVRCRVWPWFKFFRALRLAKGSIPPLKEGRISR